MLSPSAQAAGATAPDQARLDFNTTTSRLLLLRNKPVLLQHGSARRRIGAAAFDGLDESICRGRIASFEPASGGVQDLRSCLRVARHQRGRLPGQVGGHVAVMKAFLGRNTAVGKTSALEFGTGMTIGSLEVL